mmetsp:Transcript_68758/g.217462  ORF Transcript_68758/g.217462 Transcript_68758/m.217462 type:complete len:213 (+) Transcript_68758:173-811(+)
MEASSGADGVRAEGKGPPPMPPPVNTTPAAEMGGGDDAFTFAAPPPKPPAAADFTFAAPAPRAPKPSLLDRATVVDLTAPSVMARPAGEILPPEAVPSDQVQGRKKVQLEKGYSQMDWMRKVSAMRPSGARKIALKEVRKHRTLEDAWMVLHGKVYDITPYMKFHPGGVDYLMQAAGKDGTALFDKYHRWVNAHFLLEKCLLGVIDDDAHGI